MTEPCKGDCAGCAPTIEAAAAKPAPEPRGRRWSLDLVRRFTYHRPEGQKVTDHEDIRKAFLEFAEAIEGRMPEGREKSLAFTALEESSFWAHAAIARPAAD